MNDLEGTASRSAPGVLIVSDVYPPECGGSGWSTHALASMLIDRGHQVAVIELDAEMNGTASREYEGVPITTLGVGAARRSRWQRIGAHDYAYETVRRHVEQRLRAEPAWCVVHGQHLHSGPGAVAAARELGRGAVLTIRDYWPVCLHGTVWWGGSACGGCSRRNLVGCMRENFGLSALLAQLSLPLARRRLATRRSDVARAHRVIAVSQAVRDRLVAMGMRNPIDVVPNVIDPERSLAAAAAAQDVMPELPRGFVFAAGKLGPTKGFDALLEAMARVNPAPPLVIAGRGPLQADLERRARELGVDATFVGWVDGGAMLRLMQTARAVVLPSLWEEPLARVLLEAMAVGTPVISWSVASSREVIEDGVNGWLVERPAELGRALQAIRSDEVRDRAAAAAAASATALFAPAAVYPRMAAIYEGAIEASR